MAIGWRGQYTRYKEFFLNISNLYRQRADLRAFLEVILSLSTIIIFVLFALKPTALTIISLINEIKVKQQTVATLDQKIQDLQTANRIFAQNQKFIPDVDNAVSTVAQPDVVSKQINWLASKDSVSVLGLSIGEVTIIGTPKTKTASTDAKPIGGGAGEMSTSVSVKGSYTNIVSFLTDLENLRIPVKIDVTTLNSSTTDQGQSIVAVVTGRVPYLGK